MVWYAYLAATLIRLGQQYFYLFLGNSTVTGGYLFALAYGSLFALANLCLVRIFLELALKYLLEAKNVTDYRAHNETAK